MKISELIKATNATVFGEFNSNFEVQISTDTRTIQKGEIYLPLKGTTFDGEKFINQAFEKGAIGAFCTTSNITEIQKNKLLLKVPDTLIAYLQLANHKRKKQDYFVVAVTGSSGKTTTKEIISSTLSEKFKIFKTPLNYNNEIGLCQTIFATPNDTEILILEMGMRGLGEIELLSKYAEPDITVISNIGTAHIGRLGSRENIAKAKCEIVKHQRGDTFIAHDDELIKNTVNFNKEKIFYSIKDTEIIEKSINYSKFKYENNIYELNVSGDYNIENALSAINIGKKLGMSTEQIQNGLKKYKPIEKRWETINAGGYEIINDSYNANPESMKAFVNTIFELYNDFLLVLGDMRELGENEIQYHKELGEYIFKKNPNSKIITIGNLAKNIAEPNFETIEEATSYIKDNISNKTKIFLKASRSMKFEKIIEYLQN